MSNPPSLPPPFIQRAIAKFKRIARDAAAPTRKSLPAWAIMVGAVRRPLECKLTLLELIRLRDEGALAGIILSTWEGEVDRARGLREGLIAAGVTLVESPPPADLGSWNIYAQHKAMLAGLDALPSADVYVLKSRTDRAFELTWSFEPLLRTGLPEAFAAHGAPRVFEHQIICLRHSLTLPFYIGDFSFLAHARDCRRLINFDRMFDDHCRTQPMLPELRWFAPPFLRESPLLMSALRALPLVEVSTALMRFAATGSGAPLPDALSDVLALYIACLRGNFRTSLQHEPSPRQSAGDLFRPVPDGALGIETRDGYMWSIINSSQLLDAFVAGKLSPEAPFTALGERVRAGVGDLTNKILTPASLREIDAFIEAYAPPDALQRCAPPPCISKTAAPAKPTDLSIGADFEMPEARMAPLLAEIMKRAGGEGVGTALRKVAIDNLDLSKPLPEPQLAMLRAAAEMLDIDASLLLARHEITERATDWRARAQAHFAAAQDVSARSAPWRLQEIETAARILSD